MTSPSPNPAEDTAAGIAWWNAMSDAERAAQLEYAAKVLGHPVSAGHAWSLHCNRLPPTKPEREKGEAS